MHGLRVKWHTFTLSQIHRWIQYTVTYHLGALEPACELAQAMCIAIRVLPNLTPSSLDGGARRLAKQAFSARGICLAETNPRHGIVVNIHTPASPSGSAKSDLASSRYDQRSASSLENDTRLGLQQEPIEAHIKAPVNAI